MPSFPVISFNRVMQYPLTRTNAWKTQVLQYVGDQEQRWVRFNPRQEFELIFTEVDGTSISLVREFWTSMKGADQTTFSMNLGTGPHGETYSWSNLVFTDDAFKITQSGKPNMWTLTLKLRALS
jgi:hypothetical protein